MLFFEFLEQSDRIFRFTVIFCVVCTNFHPKIFLGDDFWAEAKFKKL